MNRSDAWPTSIEGDLAVIDEDIQLIMDIVRRAACLHVEAVKNGAVLEHEPKTARSRRTHFSPHPESRENQHGHLWWRGVQALKDSELLMRPVRVAGHWLEPYRRRLYAECQHPELRRLNDVVDRLRMGIMQALIDDDFHGQFETDEGCALARRLLRALVRWDYPSVATVADESPCVREGLRDVLGLTDDELIAMMCLEGPEWDSLADGDQRFDQYYAKRVAA